MLQNRLCEEVLHRVVAEAVEVEKAFICDALPCDLIGMNSSKLIIDDPGSSLSSFLSSFQNEFRNLRRDERKSALVSLG